MSKVTVEAALSNSSLLQSYHAESRNIHGFGFFTLLSVFFVSFRACLIIIIALIQIQNIHRAYFRDNHKD